MTKRLSQSDKPDKVTTSNTVSDYENSMLILEHSKSQTKIMQFASRPDFYGCISAAFNSRSHVLYHSVFIYFQEFIRIRNIKFLKSLADNLLVILKEARANFADDSKYSTQINEFINRLQSINGINPQFNIVLNDEKVKLAKSSVNEEGSHVNSAQGKGDLTRQKTKKGNKPGTNVMVLQIEGVSKRAVYAKVHKILLGQKGIVSFTTIPNSERIKLFVTRMFKLELLAHSLSVNAECYNISLVTYNTVTKTEVIVPIDAPTEEEVKALPTYLDDNFDPFEKKDKNDMEVVKSGSILKSAQDFGSNMIEGLFSTFNKKLYW